MSNADQARQLYEAFGRGEVETVVGAFHERIEWRQAEGNPYEPTGNPWVGADAITQNLFVKLATEWDGFSVLPKEFHDAGDIVVVEGRYLATHNETGKHLDAEFCHVWKFSDGEITSFQQYVDTAQLQDVTGAA